MSHSKHKETHPTYGMIGVSRVNAMPGVHLFGSRIRHNALMDITIRRAELSRELNRDWYFGSEELISVRLSEAQWASFVSSPNVGFGVPCSLEHVQGVQCGLVPPPEDSISQAKQEARKSAAELVEDLQGLCSKLEAAVEEPKKRELREILRSLKIAVDNFPSNHQFLYESFEEHVENVVTDAKASVEAHFTAIATRAGFALGEGKMDVPQIEEARKEEAAACEPIEKAIREKWEPVLQEAREREARAGEEWDEKMMQDALKNALWPVGTKLVEWSNVHFANRYLQPISVPWRKTGRVGYYEIYDKRNSQHIVGRQTHGRQMIRLALKNGKPGCKADKWTRWTDWFPEGTHPDTYEHPAKKKEALIL